MRKFRGVLAGFIGVIAVAAAAAGLCARGVLCA